MRVLAAVLVLGAAAAAAPGRNLRYAESSDRLVYAFVFGHKDTCRVIRRPQPPPFERARVPRLPATWKGGEGETLLGEFSFGRRGRPLHIALSNDGKFLVAFANRAGPGMPEQDYVWNVATGKRTLLSYEGLRGFPAPSWPDLPRKLAPLRPVEAEPASWSYAFVSKETLPGRMLVARLSEGEKGRFYEQTCFLLFPEKAEACAPEAGELRGLLKEEEPLFRAGAARQLGLLGDRESADALAEALRGTTQGAARVSIAAALVRCGDRDGRKALRSLLASEPSAAYEFATLPPDPRDADALAAMLPRLAPREAAYVSVALAGLGEKAVRALRPSVRARDADERARAAVVFGHVDSTVGERMLLKLVGDREEAVRKAAAKALTDPPRKIMESNYGAFAEALEDAGKTKTKMAAYRLATLAMHAKLKDDRILEALVGISSFHDRACRALRELTGENLDTPDDWKRWWAERK